MLRIAVTTGRLVLVVASVFLLSYLAIAFALTTLLPNNLPQREGSYFSVEGYSRDGWGNQRVRLSEPWVLRGSVRVAWLFNPWRGDGDKSRIKFQERELVSEELLVSSDAPMVPHYEVGASDRLRQALRNVEIEVQTQNPLRVEGRGLLGVQIKEIKVTPRFGLLLPAPKNAAGAVILIALVALASIGVTVDRKLKSIALLPGIIVTMGSALALATSYPENWDRALPLVGLLLLLLVGISINRFAPALVRRVSSGTKAEPTIRSNERWIVGAVCLITLGAFALRLTGLGFGLPHFYHPDEFRKARIVQDMIESGNFDPDYFKHPSFLLYGTTAVSIVSQKVFGGELNRSRVAHCGRFVSALLGTLSVPLLFLLGRALYDRRVGLIAAALLAVCPLHVVCSRYMKEDASLLFFTLLSCLLAVRAVQTRRTSFLLFSGLFAGVAASAKYSGLLAIWFSIIPAIAVIGGEILKRLPAFNTLLRGESARFWVTQPGAKRLLRLTPIALFLVVVGFLAVTPYSVLNNDRFIKDFSGEKRHMEVGHNFALTASSQFWSYHFKNSFWEALSPATALFAIVACGFLIARRRWSDLLVLSAILLFYLPAEYVRAKPEPQPERYIVPCLPFLILALSTFMIWIGRLKNRALVAILVVFSLVGPTMDSIAQAVTIRRDTRDEAAEWIFANIPADKPLVIDWGYYSPPVLDGRYPIIQLKDADGIAEHFRPRYLKQLNADYLILSSFTYERYFKSPRNLQVKRDLTYLFETLPLLAEFRSPISYGFHDPTIRVFDLRPLVVPKD